MTMARSNGVKITEALLRVAVKACEKKELRDEDCTGLLIRIQKSGGATFSWTGRDAGGKQRTSKLGAYPEMSLKQAREQATRIRLAMRSGDLSAIEGVAALVGRTNCTPEAAMVVGPPLPAVSFRDLAIEFEVIHAPKLSSWRPKRKKPAAAFREGRLEAYLAEIDDPEERLVERRSNARAVLECVFEPMLARDATELTAEDFASISVDYDRQKRRVADPDAPMTANGQVSRALAYARTVLNWAAGRGKFR